MLAYFAYGQRHYYENPVRHTARNFWEFQAIVQGRIEQTDRGSDRNAPHPRASSMWITPPGSDHGWIGEPGKAATIIVFHYKFVPETLAARLTSNQTTRITLSAKDCKQLRTVAEKVQRYWNQSLPGMLLCYEQALLTLSLMSYEALALQAPSSDKARAHERVQNALLIYNEQMGNNPSLTEIARQVHTSPAHLRRLFQESHQCAPKKMFDQLRYQRAMQLLTEPPLTMAEIAEKCGFQDQSAFSRAFKQHFQCSPSQLRIS